MNEILTINYESENPTVSARELHEKLHIGTKFTTWFPVHQRPDQIIFYWCQNVFPLWVSLKYP